MLLTIYGTEWPILCWYAVRNYSLTRCGLCLAYEWQLMGLSCLLAVRLSGNDSQQDVHLSPTSIVYFFAVQRKMQQHQRMSSIGVKTAAMGADSGEKDPP